jgi:hypothetical protein
MGGKIIFKTVAWKNYLFRSDRRYIHGSIVSEFIRLDQVIRGKIMKIEPVKRMAQRAL